MTIRDDKLHLWFYLLHPEHLTPAEKKYISLLVVIQRQLIVILENGKRKPRLWRKTHMSLYFFPQEN
jgi:hypothetical protein